MEQLSIKSKECSRQKKPDHPWRLYEWPDFVMLQTFFTTFLCLKPRLFAHPITKPPANTLDFKNFDSILQKNSVTLDKNGKAPSLSWLSCFWAGLWPAVTRTLSTSRISQTFLKHNVGNPDVW